ncbi:MAG: hypothetical protein KY412_06830 [Actinobacteria bacterium]|nr:hypothetical protein [Actinomycetota bacterium]
MNLRISGEILESFPATRVGVVIATQVDNTGGSTLLSEIKERAIEDLRRKLLACPLDEQPNIAAWRETYRAFGVNPKRLRPSAEALARRISKGRPLPEISKLVDSYNVASVCHLLPVGAYDVAKLEGPVELRFSSGGEAFRPLGEEHPTETTAEGEVVYSDDESVLTRCWNHRDGDRTKVTPESTTVVILCEAAHPSIPTDDLRSCQALLRRLVAEVCNGQAEALLLDRDRPEVEVGTGPSEPSGPVREA